MMESAPDQPPPVRPPLIAVKNLVKVYQTPAGVRFSNGAPGWSSADMHAMPAEAIGHETVECIKAAFPTARVSA